MTVYGIEGGIGTGKTLLLASFGLEDILSGRRILSNITFINIPARFRKNITYLNKDIINTMFKQVKDGKLIMKNTTILIQEMHNYIDSRTSMSMRNRTLSYWVLQSRHTGEGSCNIYYDTQELGQVDLRLRRNTDWLIRPYITGWKNRQGKISPTKPDTIGTYRPLSIYFQMFGKLGHRHVKKVGSREVFTVTRHYDTHEIVDF